MARRKRDRDSFGAVERAYDMFEQAGRHGEGHHSLADVAEGIGRTGSMRGRGRGRGDLGGLGDVRSSIVGAVASLAASSPPGGALARSTGAPLPASMGGAPSVPSGFGPNRTAFGASVGAGVAQGSRPPVLSPPPVMRPILPPRR